MTRIFIVRHAEAEGNIFRRAHGWYDAPLTENGLKQVENLRNRLIGEHIDVIYSSDLRRTMQTAGAPSLACGLAINTEPELRELAMGDWENLSWGDCEHEDAELCNSFASHADWRAPNTESVRDLYDRTGRALFRILERHAGQTVCLVSHSVAIRALMARMVFGGIENFGSVKMVPNASLSLIEYENGVFTAKFIGSNEHNAQNPVFLPKPFDGYTDRPTLWFRSATGEDAEIAAELWREAWQAVHRRRFGFDERSARGTVKVLSMTNPNAVRLAYCGDELAGVVVLDTLTDDSDVLHIVLFMLREQFRGHGLALQLLGEAVTQARLLGREALRLRVAKKNERAQKFYLQNGFVPMGDEGENILMRRPVEPTIILG